MACASSHLILIEARDWVFGILGFIVVMATTLLIEDWRVATVVLGGFVVLYLLAMFGTSRLLRESETGR